MPSEAIYHREGDLFHPTEWAGSPWSRSSQHGGPVNGLLARGLERDARERGMRPVRITMDLLGPVPLAPLTLRRRTIRDGRRHALVEATLAAGEREVARGLAVLMRPHPQLAPSWSADETRGEEAESLSATTGEDRTLPTPEELPVVPLMHRGYRDQAPPGFHWSVELRLAEGPAAGAAWIRSPLELVEGEETGPLVRSAMLSDLTFALAGRLLLRGGLTPPGSRPVMLINTDTTLYLERPPEEGWSGFRLSSLRDHEGIGVAMAERHDRLGPYGHSAQVLIASHG